MSHSAPSRENRRLPDVVPTSEELRITLRMVNDHMISLAHIYGAFDDGADEHGRGNDRANYTGRHIASMRIIEAEAMGQGRLVENIASTFHDMLSDGNIVRQTTPDHPWKFSEPEDRVYRAILGAILTHCDEDHVMDTRRLVPEGNGKNMLYVFNRNEHLKMFYAIQPTDVPHEESSDGLKVYKLRHYKDDEIRGLLDLAHSCGRTFSINRVSKKRSREYTELKTIESRMERYLKIPPLQPSIKNDTDGRDDHLFWN